MTDSSPEARQEPFDYWEWAKTAPKCEGCGHAFDSKNAALTKSPDVNRWCCRSCSQKVSHVLWR